MNEQYRQICENLGWSATEDGDGSVTLGKCSPAGEDFSITVYGQDIVDDVKAYAASFDQEEHIEMWVNARHSCSGAPSIKELVEDAAAIDGMLKELAEALFAAELATESATCPLEGNVENDHTDCAYAGDYRFIGGEYIRREEAK